MKYSPYSQAMVAALLLSCLGQGVTPAAVQEQSPHADKCVTKSSIEARGKPPEGLMGNIFLLDKSATAPPAEKVFISTFRFQAGKVEPQATLVTVGTGRTPMSDACDFRFVLIDDKDKELARYGIWNPRTAVADEGKKKGLVEVPEATYSAQFPFSLKAKEIRVLDAQQKILARTDLRKAIGEFCATHKGDNDCAAFEQKN